MSRLMTKQQNGMCAQRRLRSAWASAQSDQSLRLPHDKSLCPYLPIECTAKTLIRLSGCPGWYESLLGAQSFCWFCHDVAHITFSFPGGGDLSPTYHNQKLDLSPTYLDHKGEGPPGYPDHKDLSPTYHTPKTDLSPTYQTPKSELSPTFHTPKGKPGGTFLQEQSEFYLSQNLGFFMLHVYWSPGALRQGIGWTVFHWKLALHPIICPKNCASL